MPITPIGGSSGGGGGGGGVTSLNTQTGAVTVEAGPGVKVVTTSGTVTISTNSYMPAGW
jgi:hypothetical protein